jgi:hypothetical protein
MNNMKPEDVQMVLQMFYDGEPQSFRIRNHNRHVLDNATLLHFEATLPHTVTAPPSPTRSSTMTSN